MKAFVLLLLSLCLIVLLEQTQAGKKDGVVANPSVKCVLNGCCKGGKEKGGKRKGKKGKGGKGKGKGGKGGKGKGDEPVVAERALADDFVVPPAGPGM